MNAMQIRGRGGGIDLGGRFTVAKIRDDLAHGNHWDPGWCRAPKRGMAYRWEGEPPPTSRDGAGKSP